MILEHAAREVGEFYAYRPGVLMDVCELRADGRVELIRIKVEKVRPVPTPAPQARLYVGGRAADQVYRHIWITVGP